MNEKLKATELFHFYYCLLMEHGGGLSEEITVRVLAIKSAVKACEVVIQEYEEMNIDNKYWKRVIKELKKM